MPRFQEYMQVLAKETAWQSLQMPDSTGCYRVSLVGDIDLEFFELRSGTILLRSCVALVPDEPNKRTLFLGRVGRLMVGVRKYRATHIGLESTEQGEACIAYRKIPLSVSSAEFLQEVESTINDIAWWKRHSMEHEDAPQEQESSVSALFSQFFHNIKP